MKQIASQSKLAGLLVIDYLSVLLRSSVDSLGTIFKMVKVKIDFYGTLSFLSKSNYLLS